MPRALSWLVIAFGAIAIFTLLPARAQAGTLSLEPLRSEVTITNGSATSGQLTVRNGGDKPATVTFSAEGFSVADEAYNYTFDENAAITKWVQFSQPNLDLRPGEQKTVDYTIGAPTDAEPGGKYFALIAALQASTPSADGINPVQRAASLVYLTVPGDITKLGKLQELNLARVTKQSPVGWSMSISNRGNVHFRTRMVITGKTLWGTEVGKTEAEHLLLPNSVRYVSGNVKLGYWPGIYKVDFLIGMGDAPAVRTSRWVVYLPILLTTLILSIIILLIVLGRYVWRRRKPTGSAAQQYK